MNKIKHILIGFLFALVLVPSFSFAAIGDNEPSPTSQPNQNQKLDKPTGPGTSAENPLVECGGVSKSGQKQPDCDLSHINGLLQSILNLAFIFAGFIVAGMFMYAGFLMITATGNPAQIQKAKTIFRRVVIGFLIMFMSYLLVKNLLTNIDANDFFIKLFKN